MSVIRHEIRARCSPEHVWALLADLEAVKHYNPSVRTASIEGDQRTGVGARRSCELGPNGRVVERVTHWDEGSVLGLEVAESSFPMHFMRWVTRLEPDGADTRITQDLEYAPKFGLVGWLLDRLVLQRKLTTTLDEVFVRLVAQAEARAARP